MKTAMLFVLSGLLLCGSANAQLDATSCQADIQQYCAEVKPGGGAIMAPFFVAVLGLPVYTVAGAALMGTFVTSVAGVVFYQALAPLYPEIAVAPDWGLGLLFGLGGAAGMYCGARLQKKMPAQAIKWMLAAVILFVAVGYLRGIAKLL